MSQQRRQLYYPRRRGGPPELKISERPSRALLLICEEITQSAAPIRARAPVDLAVGYDQAKGLSTLQAICSRGAQYNALRKQVKDLIIRGFIGSSSLGGLGHAYNLITLHFPNLQHVSLDYSAMRQVYEDYEGTFETYEWKAPDFNAFHAGNNDRELRYPDRLMGVKDLAAVLENAGKEDVKVDLEMSVSWYAKGRGYYLSQACSSLTPLRRRACVHA